MAHRGHYKRYALYIQMFSQCHLNAFSKRLNGVLPSRLDNDGNGAGSGLAIMTLIHSLVYAGQIISVAFQLLVMIWAGTKGRTDHNKQLKSN